MLHMMLPIIWKEQLFLIIQEQVHYQLMLLQRQVLEHMLIGILHCQEHPDHKVKVVFQVHLVIQEQQELRGIVEQVVQVESKDIVEQVVQVESQDIVDKMVQQEHRVHQESQGIQE